MDPDRIVALAREHGCRLPVYGRLSHPGLWQAWADRIAVIAVFEGDAEAKALRIKEADRYAGHQGDRDPLPPEPPPAARAGDDVLDAIRTGLAAHAPPPRYAEQQSADALEAIRSTPTGGHP